jgi:hypothetical protein
MVPLGVETKISFSHVARKSFSHFRFDPILVTYVESVPDQHVEPDWDVHVMTVVHEKLLEKVEGQPEKGHSRSTPMELHASYVNIESKVTFVCHYTT